MKPRLIKQSERRASLGIFNPAGYEVLIALFLTSQIPFSISPSSALSFPFTLSLCLPSNRLCLCPNFPFSSLSRCTFVLSLPLWFESVSAFISFLCLHAACHMRGDTLRGTLLCFSSDTPWASATLSMLSSQSYLQDFMTWSNGGPITGHQNVKGQALVYLVVFDYLWCVHQTKQLWYLVGEVMFTVKLTQALKGETHHSLDKAEMMKLR